MKSPATFSQNMTKSSLIPLVYDDKMYHNVMEKLVYMFVVNKYYLRIYSKRFLVVEMYVFIG